jgi:hypothetical protein
MFKMIILYNITLIMVYIIGEINSSFQSEILALMTILIYKTIFS